MFKNVLVSKDFLQILPPNLAYILVHFRMLNHRLPIQRERIQNIPTEERIRTKSNSEDISDDFHYIFQCSFFTESRQKNSSSFIVEMQMLLNSTVSSAVKRNTSR